MGGNHWGFQIIYLSFTASAFFIIYAIASKQFEFETKYSSQNKYTG